jgi:glycosyltransferase involved in cell wall biosynthesis
MRILWITHDPIRTDAEKAHSSSGFWKEALFEALKIHTKIELIAACPGNRKEKVNASSYFFRYSNPKLFHQLPSKTKEDLLWIINSCKPDLIHVHGTELPYGFIKNETTVPVVISLQGFLSECCQSVLGDIPLPIWEKHKTLKEFVLKNSFLDMHRQWFLNAECEVNIIKQNKFFLGRTAFDRNVVLKHNPGAGYFQANELLRAEFYDTVWNIDNSVPYSLFTSSFSNPLKGFHFLLEAVSYLKEEFPSVSIQVPGYLSEKNSSRITGSSYAGIIKSLIEKYNLKNHVQFLGKLNGLQMAAQLQKTHAFILPSLIENSSNALGEAQVMGLPCITSPGGGTKSIIKNEVNGLFFERADAYDLAQKIRKIFLTRDLAVQLSEGAKKAGSAFHNKEIIINQYSEAYKKIVSNESFI